MSVYSRILYYTIKPPKRKQPFGGRRLRRGQFEWGPVRSVSPFPAHVKGYERRLRRGQFGRGPAQSVSPSPAHVKGYDWAGSSGGRGPGTKKAKIEKFDTN